MYKIQEKLGKIAKEISKGTRPTIVTVKSFLVWFGVSRRGNNINRQIRNELEKSM
jgi:hypothetical protein